MVESSNAGPAQGREGPGMTMADAVAAENRRMDGNGNVPEEFKGDQAADESSPKPVSAPFPIAESLKSALRSLTSE